MLMPNQTFAVNQTPVNFNSVNTMVDANGQQFYMVPVNTVRNQNFQMINAGRGNNAFGSRGRSNERNQRGQVRGRTGRRFNGRSGGCNGGRSGRGYTKHSGIFDAF